MVIPTVPCIILRSLQPNLYRCQHHKDPRLPFAPVLVSYIVDVAEADFVLASAETEENLLAFRCMVWCQKAHPDQKKTVYCLIFCGQMCTAGTICEPPLKAFLSQCLINEASSRHRAALRCHLFVSVQQHKSDSHLFSSSNPGGK